jgi:hypothetical protein
MRRLKKHESPRKQGRNNKSKIAPAKLRSQKKKFKTLKNYLLIEE